MQTATATRHLGPDLADASKFRTIARVPVLDAHAPILKTVFDPKAITRENPKGLVEMWMTASEDDLKTLAANSNRRAAAGNPPSLQLGHTPLEDKPEAYQPKHVGYATNYAVDRIGGVPHLVADFKYLASCYDECATYPRVSVERVGFDDPANHHLEAVALLRRAPERSSLPAVAYSARAHARVHYEKDRANPAADDRAWRTVNQRIVDRACLTGCRDYARVRTEVLAEIETEKRGGRANYSAGPAPVATVPVATTRERMDARVAFVCRKGLRGVSVAEVDRLMAAEDSARTNYQAAPASPPAPAIDFSDPATRAAVLAYATKHNITSIVEARRRYAASLPPDGGQPIRALYAKEQAATPAGFVHQASRPKSGFVEFCTSRGIVDPVRGRELYAKNLAGGGA